MKDNRTIDQPLDFRTYAWASPKLEMRKRIQGDIGLFARETIKKDEMLTAMGGIIVDRTQLEQLPARWMSRTIQIEDDLFQVSIREDERADFINHSCDPNTCLLYTSPSPRDQGGSRMPSSA